MIIEKPFEGVYFGNDIEKEVAEYMKSLMEYTNGEPIKKNTKKYVKEVIPDGYNVSLKGETFKRYPPALQKKVRAYWKMWDERMRKGYDGLSPMEVGYFNFAKLRGAKGPVKFRRSDNEKFWMFDACINGDNEKYEGIKRWGITEVGRRREGKTSRIGWLLLSTIRRESHVDIIVSSKTEKDAQKTVMQEKIHFMYDNLPYGMKPTSLTRSNSELWLGIKGKDEDGNMEITGRNSKIFAKAPTAESLEGSTLTMWFHDEQGKTPNFQELADMTLPALNDAEGYEREGFVIFTGVAGDMAKFPDAETIWKAAKTYKLIRLFNPGWEGWGLDEFGNEDIEKNVRQIITDRHEIMNDRTMTVAQKKSKLINNMQQFPLTVEEAFQNKEGSKWNREIINKQIDRLTESNYAPYTYKVTFNGIQAQGYPDINGLVQVIEPPKAGCRYIAAIDAYGLKQKDQGSDGGLCIFKLKNPQINPLDYQHKLAKATRVKNFETYKSLMLELGHLPVAFYINRYYDPSQFAKDAAGIMSWYWHESGSQDCGKILCETEPSTILITLMNDYIHLVAPAPIDPRKGYAEDSFGVNMKEYWTGERLSGIGHYIENYCDRLFFPDLLKNFLFYNEKDQDKKFDDVDAFGAALIWDADPRVKEWNKKIDYKEEGKEYKPMVGFSR